MAILNFRINNLTERSGQAAQRVTQYLLREGTYAPAEVGYLLRTSEDTRARGDFVAQVTGNLPAWAHDDAGAFFAAAEAYERGGSRRAGRWATTWQIALPRELTRQQQWEMGTAFVATHLARHAYLCVMHDPVKDGQHQPHLHVLFSERTDQGRVTDAETYFRRPEVGGCPKDRWFNARSSAYALREAWADWTNFTYERLSHPERVHPRSLYARDIDRKPEPKVGYSTDPARHAEREQIRAERNIVAEQAKAAAGWETRKERLAITDVYSLDPADFLHTTWAHARQQEQGQWNRDFAAIPRQRTVAREQRAQERLHLERQWITTHTEALAGALRQADYWAQSGKVPTRGMEDRQRALVAAEFHIPSVTIEHAHGRAVRSRIFDEERDHTHSRGGYER